MVMAKDTKKKQVACCPTYSDFFEHFVKGLHKRMGNIVRPDWAISHEIVKNVLDTMEEEWETESVHSQQLDLALEGAYYVLGLTLALRGEELTLVEMRGVRKYWEEATQHKTPHIVITLMGRLKNEICESYHLMPVMCSTPRDLHPEKWTRRVLEEYKCQNILSGYMFRNQDGVRWNNKVIEGKFYGRLEAVRVARPNLISQDTKIQEEYGVSRSFQRGGTSSATNHWAPLWSSS